MYWKNCPTAWQQSFKGKASGPTIVLEAIADYNLWFWHLSYGYSGALNDLNILNLSPLLNKLTDGSFIELERSTGVVPFSFPGTAREFDKTFLLVDGIYPKYSRFVRGYKEPITPFEEKFIEWQESARKDVESFWSLPVSMEGYHISYSYLFI
jgi:Plant transposon protein